VACEDLLILEEVIARIRKEYFEDHELLFDDVKSSFQEQLQSVRVFSEYFNSLNKEQTEPPIDIDLCRGALEAEVREQISRWRDLARLETLSRFGEGDFCRALLEKTTGHGSTSSSLQQVLCI
jgi:hypothetical protein